MIYDLTNQNIKTILASEKLVVIDFYAPWCGPCIAIKPIFHKVAEDLASSCTFGQINIDEARDLAIEYRVSSIPTLIAIKNNRVAWAHTGTISENDLKNNIKALL